ncbi:MAG: hypothetical protein U0X73_15205 [Thermoanaerobaculia bacterium]
MLRRLLPLLLLAALAAPPAGATAGFSFYGTTLTNRTFNRPNTDLTTLSGKTTQYHQQAFFVNSAAVCDLRSAQEGTFDGLIYLYRGAFDPTSPLVNLIAANDNGGLGVGTSDLAGVALGADQSYYLITTSVEPAVTGNFTNFVECSGATRILAGDGAMPSLDGRYSELNRGRFRISATWKDFQGHTGNGTFVPLGSEDSGILWFFSPSNFEVMIKILNGCDLNNRYWVFYAALTTVEFHLTVYDTFAEVTKTYDNALGVSAQATTDTAAFATCP